MENELPHLENVNGQWRLIVDGKPFLILGLQWACDSCFSPEEMDPLFPHAAKMGANTAALPVYWKEIEPEPGQYNFHMLAERIQMAKENNMRLVLLWFATWKNACYLYVPGYIRQDPQQYQVALDPQGELTVSLCPSCENTWRRDRDALLAMMTYLREHDDTHRVILVQIENEAGVLDTPRCHCPVCNQRFIEEGWQERYGKEAEERFSVAGIATYIDRLAVETKAVYPLPVYANVALPFEVGAIPGTYFTGGAIPEMLEQYRSCAPHLDLIGPDIYFHGYRDFHRFSRIYSAGGYPYYVAETSSSPTGRAERNAFYAIGQYGAIGFDPWAIDSPYPERVVHPLVDALGGEWGPQAYWLRDSYVAIGRAMQPIIEAQGTDRLFTFVQEPGEYEAGWANEDCDVIIHYRDKENAGRGMIVRIARDQYLLIGVGFYAKFRRPRPDGRPIAYRSREWGYYRDSQWVGLRPMSREHRECDGTPIEFLEPGVMRVFLDL